MMSLRENCQSLFVFLFFTLTACSPMPMSGVDAGVVTDAGVVLDAGQPLDAGAEADAGVDAGVVVVPTGWAPTTGTPYPTGLWGTVLAFDPVDRRFILHGGNRSPMGSVQNETWSFSIATSTWTKLTTTGPMMPYRYCHCTTYLPAQRQVLIVGGRNVNAPVDSAYTLDLATLEWTQVTGTVPTGGIGCSAHWLGGSVNRAIVFGGDGVGGVNARTWSYDPTARTFTLLTPATSAAARRDGMSVVDGNNRVLLFGGAVQIMSSYLDDVATFDGTTWTQAMNLGTRPSPRRYGATGFDGLRQKWVVFGGTNDADSYDDLWVVDPATLAFEQRTLPGKPTARGFAASGVDETTGVLYVFGGLNAAFQAKSDGFTLKLQ